MTLQANPALRSVVLPSPDGDSDQSPTRLLRQLGHAVERATSPQHALQLLKSHPTDLVVIDLTNAKGNRELISRIVELPVDRRPGQVAVFNDRMDSELREWRRQISPTRMHVYFKPLHLHGLLNVLRKMQRQADPGQPAGV